VAEGSFITVAVKLCVALTTTLAAVGETETLMAGTVMVVEPDLVGSATAVAVMVTVKLLAGGPGAVYVVGLDVLLVNEPQVAIPHIRLQVAI
jgi:hypothetical protein